MKKRNLIFVLLAAFLFFLLIYVERRFDLMGFVCRNYDAFCIFFKIVYYSFLGFLIVDIFVLLYKIFSEFYS